MTTAICGVLALLALRYLIFPALLATVPMIAALNREMRAEDERRALREAEIQRELQTLAEAALRGRPSNVVPFRKRARR
jgi:hypothetical protein